MHAVIKYLTYIYLICSIMFIQLTRQDTYVSFICYKGVVSLIQIPIAFIYLVKYGSGCVWEL